MAINSRRIAMKHHSAPRHPRIQPGALARTAEVIMRKTLFVGGLSVATSRERLRAAFASVGVVESVTIATDHAGRSRGFGFVEMADEPSASEAVWRLNGHELDGRRLRAEFASPARARTSSRPGRTGAREPRR